MPLEDYNQTLDQYLAFQRFKKWDYLNFIIGYIPSIQHYIVITNSFCLLDNLEKTNYSTKLSLDEAIKQTYKIYPDLQLEKTTPQTYSSTVVKKTVDEILSIPIFRKFKSRINSVKIIYSEYLNQYAVASEQGILFEDSVWYSYDELMALNKKPSSEREIKVIHELKKTFDGSKVLE